ncbi:protein kinase domain-containing protein [Aestuariibacter salexigens]|uniref:protein kinase domain-containing protein n=1 Tax=Aestuariibacter salexigens TaxID=226010 RepID=UPI00041955EF|nr:protein kinase [Aestuariibacter salexigens]
MIDAFKTSLKRFLDGSLSLSQLKQDLQDALNASEDNRAKIQHVLLELFSRKLIDKQTFDALYLDSSRPAETSAKDTQRNTPSSSGASGLSFQKAVKQYQKRLCSLNELEQSLERELLDNLNKLDEYYRIVTQLDERQLLPKSACQALFATINRATTQRAESSQTDTLGKTVSRTVISPSEQAELQDDNAGIQEDNSVEEITSQVLVEDTSDSGSEVASEQDESSEPEAGSTASDEQENEKPTPKTEGEEKSAAQTLTEVLDTFLKHRMSYQAFEQTALDLLAQSDEHEKLVAIIADAYLQETLNEAVYEHLRDKAREAGSEAEWPDKIQQEPELEPELEPESVAADLSPDEGEHQESDPVSEANLALEEDLTGGDVLVTEGDNIDSAETVDAGVEQTPEPEHVPDTSPDVEENQDEPLDDDKTVIKKPQASALPNPDPEPESDADDDDKTVIKQHTPTPSVESQDDDKTVIKKPAREEPDDIDDDKTVVAPKRPLSVDGAAEEDDDKTRVKVSTDDSDSDTITSITSSTETDTFFNTETSLTSGTSSTWSKPFQASENVDNVSVGSVLKNRFRLIEFIGRGGMGDVYKAEDLRRVDAGDVETEVAVKVLNDEFRDHPDSLKALQREARKTQNLAHPHIVNVFDFDRDEQHIFMTMELMTGDPLNKVIKQHPNGVELATARRWIKELSSALEYAHRRGVVHSDLKPGNVFISRDEVKVFDFGIARAASTGEHTDNDTFDAGDIGALTPTYASPEMLDNSADADPRDDIYALACIAYELISGRHPFLKDGKKIPAVEAAEMGLKPPKLKKLKPWQSQVLQRSLAFERNDRTPSVKEFLDEFLKQEVKLSTKQKVTRIAIASALIIGTSGTYFYLNHKELSEFEALLTARKDSAILIEFDKWFDKSESAQQDFFSNDKVKGKLESYLLNRPISLARSGEFELASQVLQYGRTVAKNMGDGRFLQLKLNETEQQFEKLKDDRLKELYAQSQLLTEMPSDEFKTSFASFDAIWNEIKQINPDDAFLRSAAPRTKLYEEINQSVSDGDFDSAFRMAEFAAGFYQKFEALTPFIEENGQLLASIVERRDAAAVKAEVQQLRQVLSAIPDDATLQEFTSASTAISSLRNLAPRDELLRRIEGMVEDVLTDQLEPLIETAQWSQAESLLADNSELIDVSKLQSRVADLKTEWQNQIADAKRRIRNLSREGEPKAVELENARFAELKPTQSDVNEMSDVVASSYLLEARRARTQELWEDAQAALDKAGSFAKSEAVKTSITDEEGVLVAAQQDQRNLLDRQAAEQRQLQEQQRIAALEQNVIDISRKQQLNASDIIAFEAAVETLKIESQGSLVIDSAEQEFITRFMQQIRSQSNSDLASALDDANALAEYFADNVMVKQLQTELSQKSQTLEMQAVETRAAELERELLTLLEREDSTVRQSALKKLLRDFEQLDVAEQRKQDVKTRIITSYLTLFDEQLLNNAFSAAREVVDVVSEFDPSRDTGIYLDRIDEAQQSYAAAEEARQKQIRINSIRAELTSQIQASGFESAEEKRQELRSLGVLDAELALEIATEFSQKYQELASQAAGLGNFTDAKMNIDRARAELPSSNELDRLYELYRVAENIVSVAQTDPAAALAIKNSALERFANNPIIANIDISMSSSQSAPVSTPNVERRSAVSNESPSSTIVPEEPQVKQVEVPQTEPESEPVQETVKTAPPVAISKPKRRPAVPCTESMAGNGKSCSDYMLDNVRGPNMVVVPGMTGQQTPYAISRYEIRLGVYEVFCEQTGKCGASINDLKSAAQSYRRPELYPVVGRPVAEIVSFAQWLSDSTGFNYRVPTVEQWQHAARAGGNGETKEKNCRVFSGGNLVAGIRMELINYESRDTVNAWGITNHLGNAQELVSDGGVFVAMGGYWDDEYRDCVVESRRSVGSNGEENTGFRLVRSL